MDMRAVTSCLQACQTPTLHTAANIAGLPTAAALIVAAVAAAAFIAATIVVHHGNACTHAASAVAAAAAAAASAAAADASVGAGSKASCRACSYLRCPGPRCGSCYQTLTPASSCTRCAWCATWRGRRGCWSGRGRSCCSCLRPACNPPRERTIRLPSLCLTFPDCLMRCTGRQPICPRLQAATAGHTALANPHKLGTSLAVPKPPSAAIIRG